MKEMLHSLLPHCQNCGCASTRWLCAPCVQKLSTFSFCLQCGRGRLAPGLRRCLPCQKKRTPWRNLRIAFCYNEGIRNWLHALKNRGELSRLRELRAKDLPAVEDSYDAIISVTSDPQRRRDRLFDWGQVYSSRLAKIWNLPQPRSPFERRPFLSPQKELGRDERLRYLRKLVSLRESPNRTGKKKWKSVLLVDDVMTTGASLEIHAELLKKVADVVDVFCLSRTPLDERIDF